MYANRYAGSRGFKPASLGASLLVNGAVVLGLIYAAPKIVPTHAPRLTIHDIDLAPPPPPPEPQPHPHVARTAAVPQPTAPRPTVIVPNDTPPITLMPLQPPAGPVDLGNAPGPAAQPSPAPLPALIDATADPRYADDFQPAYPPEERRAGNAGRVVVRVLIGVDGRVKQVDKVSAASDAFFAATRDQALRKWRFRPATRGGVPVESWKTMGVTFRLQDE